jgi:hypothetical protein
LSLAAEAPIGRWSQGLAWNRLSDRILVQSAADNVIEVFDFNGRTLTPRTSIRVNGSPTGIRTAR